MSALKSELYNWMFTRKRMTISVDKDDYIFYSGWYNLLKGCVYLGETSGVHS